MRRVLFATFLISAALLGARAIHAQGDSGYRLVPNWPKLPPGMYFGLKDAPPPPAEREAQAAARRARGGGAGGGGGGQAGGPTNQPGISGLAIDAQDHIYVFNRGVKPVMVFDRDGKMILAGADQEINGKKIGNRYAVQPMEGWDGTTTGGITPEVLRRWQRFGESGAKLIFGGEAMAVRPDGRANPNQLIIDESNQAGLAKLRE